MTLPARAPDRTEPRHYRVVQLVTHPPERVKCPRGHPIHANAGTFDGRGHLTCHYGQSRGHPGCNAVMLVSSGIRDKDGGWNRMEIHVGYDELRVIEQHHMSLTAMLAYLGVPWPAHLINPETSAGR